jgi:hypothetical protein
MADLTTKVVLGMDASGAIVGAKQMQDTLDRLTKAIEGMGKTAKAAGQEGAEGSRERQQEHLKEATGLDWLVNKLKEHRREEVQQRRMSRFFIGELNQISGVLGQMGAQGQTFARTLGTFVGAFAAGNFLGIAVEGVKMLVEHIGHGGEKSKEAKAAMDKWLESLKSKTDQAIGKIKELQDKINKLRPQDIAARESRDATELLKFSQDRRDQIQAQLAADDKQRDLEKRLLLQKAGGDAASERERREAAKTTYDQEVARADAYAEAVLGKQAPATPRAKIESKTLSKEMRKSLEEQLGKLNEEMPALEGQAGAEKQKKISTQKDADQTRVEMLDELTRAGEVWERKVRDLELETSNLSDADQRWEKTSNALTDQLHSEEDALAKKFETERKAITAQLAETTNTEERARLTKDLNQTYGNHRVALDRLVDGYERAKIAAEKYEGKLRTKELEKHVKTINDMADALERQAKTAKLSPEEKFKADKLEEFRKSTLDEKGVPVPGLEVGSPAYLDGLAKVLKAVYDIQEAEKQTFDLAKEFGKELESSLASYLHSSIYDLLFGPNGEDTARMQQDLQKLEGQLEVEKAKITQASTMSETQKKYAIDRVTTSYQQQMDGIRNSSEYTVSAFSRISDAFLKMLEKMVSDLAASQLMALLKQLGQMLADINWGGRPSETDFNPQGLASGGMVRGPGGPTADRVPIMASAGEFVMSAAAVRRVGPGFLHKLNDGISPKHYASGGYVGDSPSAISSDVDVNIINNTGQQASATRRQGSDGKEIIDVVIGAVADSIRSGGQVGQAVQQTYGVQKVGVRRG